MSISAKDIQRVQERNMWGFGNHILYNMCKKVPLHEIEDEIIGEVWLIGRSYAAALERGTNDIGDRFYPDVVAPKIRAVGVELDRKIADLQHYRKVSKELLGEIIETHNFLTEVFKEITGRTNRSLASKYLHFHLPNMFYIYDSRSIHSVTKEKTDHKALKKELMCYRGDSTYTDFLAKMYTLNVDIFNLYDQWLSPRQLDALLLGY